jgi:hypothetical protein
MRRATYEHLDQILKAQGFTFELWPGDPPARAYRHPGFGALVLLPVLPWKEPVLSRHVGAVQTVLDVYGLADPVEFALRLRQAG